MDDLLQKMLRIVLGWILLWRILGWILSHSGTSLEYSEEDPEVGFWLGSSMEDLL